MLSLIGLSGITLFCKTLCEKIVSLLICVRDLSALVSDFNLDGKDVEGLKKVVKNCKEVLPKVMQLGCLIAFRRVVIETLKSLFKMNDYLMIGILKVLDLQHEMTDVAENDILLDLQDQLNQAMKPLSNLLQDKFNSIE